MSSIAVGPVDLTVEVTRDEVHRALGYRRKKSPRPDIARRLDQLWQPALALLSPRGACRVVAGTVAAGLDMPKPTEEVGLGLCTIGPALEAEAQRASERGDLLDALLYDAIGSTAAEAAAEALDRLLGAAVAATGRRTARRISPGYGKWPVTAQPALLAQLPAAELGIRLTEGLMMIPRKSVSFAARLHPDCEAIVETGDRCVECPLVDCPQRREPTDPETEPTS